MTESEAKKRWCPFVRMHSPGSGACNRETQTPDMQYYKCIGSDCMAFRFVDDLDGYQGFVGVDGEIVIATTNELLNQCKEDGLPRYVSTQTYCGLAGKL